MKLQSSVQSPLLVSKQEAARQLGISLRSLEALIARRELQCRRIGRRVLVPFAELVSFASTYRKFKRSHLSETGE